VAGAQQLVMASGKILFRTLGSAVYELEPKHASEISFAGESSPRGNRSTPESSCESGCTTELSQGERLRQRKDMFRLPLHADKRYTAVNCCIYCRSENALSDEHIIPFGLGGR
jgi:hypothetical protein